MEELPPCPTEANLSERAGHTWGSSARAAAAAWQAEPEPAVEVAVAAAAEGMEADYIEQAVLEVAGLAADTRLTAAVAVECTVQEALAELELELAPALVLEPVPVLVVVAGLVAADGTVKVADTVTAEEAEFAAEVVAVVDPEKKAQVLAGKWATLGPKRKPQKEGERR